MYIYTYIYVPICIYNIYIYIYIYIKARKTRWHVSTFLACRARSLGDLFLFSDTAHNEHS